MTAVSIRLPDEIAQRLGRLADLTGRSKTFYMIEAIKEHIDDLEDVFLAEQRLADIQTGKTTTISIDDIIKRYDLEN